MIKVLKKTVDILEVIADQGGTAYTDILEKTGLNKATLSNILKSLRELGLVDRDESGLFCIGLKAIELTRKEINKDSLAGAGGESASRLLKNTGETITAASFSEGDRYILAKANPEASMVVSESYTSNPGFYNTATGRALFAFMDDGDRNAVVDRHGMPGESWKGMTDLAAVSRECASIRNKGYVSFRVQDGLIQYIGVPVLRSDGTVCASIGAAVPSVRISDTYEKHIIDELQQEARRMQETLRLRNLM